MMRSKHEAATVAATDSETVPRIEIVGERRRAHDVAFRAMVVAESVAAGASVPDIAERHGLSPSLVYRWRRHAGAEMAGGLAVRLFPVRIAAAPDKTPAAVPPPSRTRARRAGLIEIELSGGVRVSIDEGVSLAALRRVMSVLRG